MSPTPTAPIDARQHLQSLLGRTILTLTGRPNRVLEVRGSDVIVGTDRSPQGKPIPIQEVQDGLDGLIRDGEIEISVDSVGYRSAFIGAVLLAVPRARGAVNPRRVTLDRPPA
jgi:hypothetical protein